MSLHFLLTSLIIIVSPGTGVLYTLSTGLSQGKRASIIAALGCTLGILPHMMAAVSGLAALLYASALAFQVLKYLGVVYLLYMAWITLREKGMLQVTEKSVLRSDKTLILSGILINILNPKLSIFFFAFLPQFVNSGESGVIGHMLKLSAVFMVLTFLVFVLYGVFAAAVRRYITHYPRLLIWMRRTFAAAFLALGAKLALADR